MFLSSRNININKSIKKLENKMLDSFSIIKHVKVLYKLELPIFIKIYNVFYLNLLRVDFDNSLSSQI